MAKNRVSQTVSNTVDTILSSLEVDDLSFEELVLSTDLSRDTLNRLLPKLIEKGWIVKIKRFPQSKKEMYGLSDKSVREQGALSVVIRRLRSRAYSVSFGMADPVYFPQAPLVQSMSSFASPGLPPIYSGIANAAGEEFLLSWLLEEAAKGRIDSHLLIEKTRGAARKVLPLIRRNLPRTNQILVVEIDLKRLSSLVSKKYVSYLLSKFQSSDRVKDIQRPELQERALELIKKKGQIDLESLERLLGAPSSEIERILDPTSVKELNLSLAKKKSNPSRELKFGRSKLVLTLRPQNKPLNKVKVGKRTVYLCLQENSSV